MWDGEYATGNKPIVAGWCEHHFIAANLISELDKRVDPDGIYFDKAKTSSEQTTIEYLIFFRGSEKPEKFRHRFVIDGEKKYLKTRGQMREAWEKTTQDEVESLNDFLINSPGCLLLNLTSMFGLFLSHLLVGEDVT